MAEGNFRKVEDIAAAFGDGAMAVRMRALNETNPLVSPFEIVAATSSPRPSLLDRIESGREGDKAQ